MDRNEESPQESELSRRVRELAGEPALEHPWKGLEAVLAADGIDRLRLIGYGSLVNAKSASVTVAEQVARDAKPAMAFGARRVFDYRMDEENSRYLRPEEPDALALLNVHLTGDPDDCLNGVVIETPLGDLPALREREADYSLARIAFRFWEGEEIHSAWILTCAEGSRGGPSRLQSNLTPNLDYYRVCRDGAASFGPAFLDAWLDTTYLGDATTTVRDWERDASARFG